MDRSFYKTLRRHQNKACKANGGKKAALCYLGYHPTHGYKTKIYFDYSVVEMGFSKKAFESGQIYLDGVQLDVNRAQELGLSTDQGYGVLASNTICEMGFFSQDETLNALIEKQEFSQNQ